MYLILILFLLDLKQFLFSAIQTMLRKETLQAVLQAIFRRKMQAVDTTTLMIFGMMDVQSIKEVWCLKSVMKIGMTETDRKDLPRLKMSKCISNEEK